MRAREATALRTRYQKCGRCNSDEWELTRVCDFVSRHNETSNWKLLHWIHHGHIQTIPASQRRSDLCVSYRWLRPRPIEVGGNEWGNNELEYYASPTENAFLNGAGFLVIKAGRGSIGRLPRIAHRIRDFDSKWAMVGGVRAFLAQRYAPDAFNIAVNDGIAARTNHLAG